LYVIAQDVELNDFTSIRLLSSSMKKHVIGLG